MLPLAPGITGYYTEESNKLLLEIRSLRNSKTVTFFIKDSTIISTIKSEFSPILEDYLSDSVPGFSDAFMEMQSHPIPVDGEERELEIFSGVEMKFCWIPAGKAMLGSPKTEHNRNCNEIEHEFETSGFWLGKYPVTQSQWKGVMGNSPSYFNGVNLPVEQVNWDDCQEFINKCDVSELKVQLPHEDQWEYSCRGGKGNKQAFYWGDELNGDKANCKGTEPYGSDKKGAYLARTTEVGSYEKVAPHPWGLCDMSGNVWEWCENSHDKEDLFRMNRGGSWCSVPRWCRSAIRSRYFKACRLSNFGFRLIIY